jgi:pimeloyl-ACP methyl ester carboxylesterase
VGSKRGAIASFPDRRGRDGQAYLARETQTEGPATLKEMNAMKRSLMLVLTLVGAVLLTSAFVHLVAAADTASAAQPVAQESLAAHPQIPGPQSAAPASNCEDDVQESGAKYRICMPAGEWDDLVVYAHGYMAADRPVEIPEDQMTLPGTPWTVDQIVNLMGFAFATTSYYTNGLAVLPAMSDLLDLVDVFSTAKGVPDHVYLVGVSEGGLITALSVEQHPDVYDGGLAMCGPYGDFRQQINHFGDFRVVFDYFFPELMPGEPLSIPASLQDEWQSGFFTETILPEITDPANVMSVTQLLTVTDVSPYAYAPPTSTDSIEHLLWYNVFATNDGIAKLAGQPFDNQDRTYSGSDNDALLNQGVERISADQAALDEIEAHYQTTGKLSVPLVTMHTTGDEVVPYRHAALYREKTRSAGNSLLHQHIEVDRHGHCAFSFQNINDAFETLLNMVNNPPSYVLLPLVVRAP